MLGEIVFNQQVLRHRDQEPVCRMAQAGLQQPVHPLFFTPDRAQHQDPLGCSLPDLGEHLGVAGADLEQDLIRSAPELALANDLQEQRVVRVGVVLDAFRRRVGAAAGDHHGLIPVEQERSGDVLSRHRREGDRIDAEVLEQVMGEGRGGIQITVLGINDQREVPRHQIPHLQQQLQTEGAEGLIEAQARFDGADVGTGFLDDGLDPMAGLTEERPVSHPAALSPALQHLRVGVQSRHQQGLALCDGFSELNEEAHRPLAA